VSEFTATKSLFDRLGGTKALDVAVDIFYDKVVKDPVLKDFFINVDMVKQPAKMKTFLAYAFGGPVKYTGKDMRQAHAHMALSEIHFLAVRNHLKATLAELGADDGTIDEVLAIADSTKADVLQS